jgi:hypothetical protein
MTDSLGAAELYREAAGSGECSKEIDMKQEMQNSSSRREETASESISERIEELSDWRGEALEKVRRVIQEADPEIVEEWKWSKPSSPGTPVWSHSGGICTGETYKNKVKLTFFRGAALQDPSGLFNSSLEGKVRRAIDIYEGDTINETALKALILEAVALNLERKK